jgi:hypothetical protein
MLCNLPDESVSPVAGASVRQASLSLLSRSPSSLLVSSLTNSPFLLTYIQGWSNRKSRNELHSGSTWGSLHRHVGRKNGKAWSVLRAAWHFVTVTVEHATANTQTYTHEAAAFIYTPHQPHTLATRNLRRKRPSAKNFLSGNCGAANRCRVICEARYLGQEKFLFCKFAKNVSTSKSCSNCFYPSYNPIKVVSYSRVPFL